MKRWLGRPEGALLAMVLGAYAYFYQAGGWNQNSRFDLTRALVEDHTLSIDRFAQNTQDTAERSGHVFCDKAPGVSFAGAVPYAIAHALFGPPRSVASLGWAAWLSTLFAVGLPSALGIVALAMLLGTLGLPAHARVGLAAAWALATLAFPYATLYYGHQLIAALLATAFALLVRIRRGLDPPSPGRLIAVGALCGWAIVVEYTAAIAVAVIAVYALRAVKARAMLWAVVGGLGPVLVLLWYHATAFGAPWHLPYDFSTQDSRHEGFFMGIGAPRLRVLWAILGSPFRGLFFSAPWLLLALPGAVRLARRGFRAEALACAAIAILFVWMNASLVDWHGGWAIGPRHLVPCIPFLVVLAAGWLVAPAAHAAPARIAVGLLVGYSAFLMLAGTAVQPEVDFSFRAPFGDYILPRLVLGEVSTSDQSIDIPDRDRHGARYAWNLGLQLGLPGLVSLLPLVMWCGAWSWVLARRAQQEG